VLLPATQPASGLLRQLLRLRLPGLSPFNTWYGNNLGSGTFDRNAVPTCWSNSQDIGIYQSTIARSCRNCHMADHAGGITFEAPGQFNALANLSVFDICGNSMPHALQTMREFWLSGAPLNLANYWYSIGLNSAADTLLGRNGNPPCGGTPGVVTLDPPPLAALM
jgi:hypothetical protein